MRRFAIFAALSVLLLLVAGAAAYWFVVRDKDVTSAGSTRLVKVADLESPTFLGSPKADARQFITERAGQVRILEDGRLQKQPFLDIGANVSTVGEGGLLSVAFAPDYESSRLFYVYYVDKAGQIRIDGYRTRRDDPDRADPGSRTEIMRVPHPNDNHKGGQLQFGPDGYLYAGFGDGGGQGDPERNGQDLSQLLGKLIRIDPRPGGGYDIPGDNPFRDRAGARPEIFSYGLRNPWRFSFDRETGDLVIADVGQEEVEEVDFVAVQGEDGPAGGQNFGWSSFEGSRRFNKGSAADHVRPALEEVREDGYCSIIGGYVIRDESLGPEWDGRYVYGDLCESELQRAKLSTDGESASEGSGVAVTQLVSFGEDAEGRIYALSLNGPVYRVEASTG
jgi:glucose/arabinose dehydrogenase